MSITGIILATVIVGGTGLFIGVFLGISGKSSLSRRMNERKRFWKSFPVITVEAAGMRAVPAWRPRSWPGEAEAGGCPVGGTPVAEKIGQIMGVDVSAQERMTAFVKCGGTCEKAKTEYEYYGIKDCIMASQMQDGGAKGCAYGCLGYGSCVDACMFDAIHIVDGIAVVDKEACKACGKCVEVCPKHLIELIPYKQRTFVQCNSNEKGKVLMDACQVGCIGCRLCERSCEAGAVTVNNFLAHIDPEKCTNCGVCAEKCPRKIIKM